MISVIVRALCQLFTAVFTIVRALRGEALGKLLAAHVTVVISIAVSAFGEDL